MAEQAENSENEAAAGEIRSKLLGRLAVAGVLVAALLGTLAFFDHLATVPDDTEEQVFTQPVPVAPKKEASQPLTPAENLPAPPEPVKEEAPVEPPPPPHVETHEAVEVKPEPAAENRPKSQLTVATAKKTPAPPPEVAAAPASVPEATMAPSNILPPTDAAVPAEPAPPKAAARIVETRRATPPMPPVVSRLFSGFLLQAGVFSSVERAEELHARLTLSGVPSTLETRVQVGPFKSKREAEAAQAKLKELGVETILVPPRGKH
ncbi:MAG: SPOR domain-containing protein [Gammaproteobacteria bacterium]|nr:SPOR domain-containing protein [Gammaproteobacteria bacterium]MBU1603647.1 SPOR domain-containing protein [Gammaproteobacteria bacterium]MBU2435420.1 SPOR domain-containing protein [Gammaproteobacteria bacterium]MBU2449167.1 SPOR domain-containing protein [Gammaproteobacteria bacterium]